MLAIYVYSKTQFSKQKVCKTFFTIYIDLKSVCVQCINSPIKSKIHNIIETGHS